MNEHELMRKEIETLLAGYGVDDTARNVIAPMVAKKSLEMNHLYEDLGFKNRIEMGRFMMSHFPELAARKPKEKLWKKYLYDRIDKIAPACATCDDQSTCFRCIVKEMSA